jgi:hypothetical protein
MSIGKVTQPLYLTGLPEGAIFSVVDINTPNDDTWYTYFNRTAPFSVTGTQAQPGLMGESIIQTRSVYGGGASPYVTLICQLQVPGNGAMVSKLVYLNISATQFGKIQRPDYSLLTFTIDNQIPQTASQPISTLQAPDPIYVGFAVSNDQVVIAASPQNLLTTQVLAGLINGVLTINKELVSWMTGKLW